MKQLCALSFNLCGFSLGSFHDGDAFEQLAGNCAVADNFIMTPTIGASSENLLNLFRFSSCTLAQFKSILLSTDLTYVCKQGVD
jgi:hypothetical protein